PTILLRPGHADPAAVTQQARKLRIEDYPAVRTPFGGMPTSVLSQELANLPAQLPGRGGQDSRIETEVRHEVAHLAPLGVAANKTNNAFAYWQWTPRDQRARKALDLATCRLNVARLELQKLIICQR